jgi:uncharacterized membrane protein SpoIIM required for sporulation
MPGRSSNEYLDKARRLSLARVPLDLFRQGSALYRQAVADLAYARMCFPGHPVVKELEQLVGGAHSTLYQAGRSKSRNWSTFWRTTWPSSVRQAARPILLATAVFWAGSVVSFFLTMQNPVLENFFISAPMRSAINAKHLWTESLTKTAPASGSGIATNNIRVTLLTWAMGVTFGIGTVWLLFFNGLMLGAISAACLRADMLGPLAEFIVAHGSLELPAIWISGGAGLLLGQAMLFPGRYSRSVELRKSGRQSVQIIVGIVPMLLIAGGIEAFISPSDISGGAKAGLGACLLLVLIGYIVIQGKLTTTAALLPGDHP